MDRTTYLTGTGRGRWGRLAMGLSSSKSFWWHRHLAGATHRLEACATEFEFLFFSTRFCFKPVELPKKLVHFLVAA
jgi:hypothetical protein